MEQEETAPKLRIGVVYDGYYFFRVSTYYREEHSEGQHISIKGLNDFILAKVAEARNVDPSDCYIASSQYFSGRSSVDEISSSNMELIRERQVDEALRRNNVNPNYLPNEGYKEKGVDVFLATTALEMVINLRLDVMVIITGDGDFQTLPQTLSRWGCETMLVSWDYDSKKEKADGSTSQTRTSRHLLANVHHPFEMYMLIEEGIKKNNPLILGLFGRTPVTKNEKMPRFLVGEIVTLHKREGTVKVRGKLIKFFRGDPGLGIDFDKLKKGLLVKLRMETNGKYEKVLDLALLG